MLVPFTPLPLLLLFLLIPPLRSSLLPISLHSASECPIRLPFTDTSQARIVGGQTAQHFIRSHMISFHREGCGGSLISPTWIVTAAHCLISTSSTPTYAGSNSNNGIPLTIKKVHVHPAYDFPRNDITLVQLAAPVPLDARFFAVNANPNVPAEGEFARVAGYGHTHEYNSDNYDSQLHQVDVPVVTTADCITAFDQLDTEIKGKIQHSMHICAGYDDGKCDSCIQDSGSPLFVYAPDGGLVQIAIVSFGYGCARPGLPGGYVRLSKYRKWMRDIGAAFDEVTVRNPVFLEGFEPARGEGGDKDEHGSGESGGNDGTLGNSQDVNATESAGEENGESGETVMVGGDDGDSSQVPDAGQYTLQDAPMGPEAAEFAAESDSGESNFGTTAGTTEVEGGQTDGSDGGVSNTVIIVSSSVAGAAFVSAVLLVVWWRRRLHSRECLTSEGSRDVEEQEPRV